MKNSRLSRSLVFAVIIAVTLAVSANGNPNLVVNGGFETGDESGWNSVWWITDGVDTSSAHSGSYGYYNAYNDPGTWAVVYQLIPTTPGSTYTLDFWLRNVGGGNLNEVSVRWTHGGLFQDLNAPAFDWTQFTYTVTGTSDSDSGVFFSFKTDSRFNLDDVSLTAVPDFACTCYLVGLGLFGLVALRRKLR